MRSNMSGDSRERKSTAASNFLAAAWASALSRMADSALRLISKTGSEACDMVSGMDGVHCLGDWVWAIGGSVGESLARIERRRNPRVKFSVPISLDGTVGSVRVFAQHRPQRGFSRPVGFRHGLEIDLGVVDRAGSAGAIDLPAP